ncbi:SPRY domain-containing protein [Colletotrichum scovillei]|uniref:SPRY domain-containing protein n=1 Tax=Colletotrichum scovillei TaxID=1209932 RepID=A0A9P7REB7_9PEZI|nr:SPRY domain-containing protein [Colletotrichum scovillei]KAF4785590.1 SPRY domain-containing protein [Colletotrichum scovillei]KAG7055093.1 SPRY domain-containing protein [Colletotrichum scovillei]KAG7074538.1 SPRY domain-containing protein [Colletotrichum scovillei]KAG7081691.1 SPRY domain-containing protein [Colletotrichum scovillei]
MTNPFHGSAHYTESNTPTGSSGLLPRRFSYASVASGAPPNYNPPYLSHPGRTSVISQILNNSDDITFEPASAYHDSSRGGDMDADRNGASLNGTSARLSRGANNLPSFSRVFDMFMANPSGENGGPGGASGHGGFFVPSYLTGSTYVQRLEEAHFAKVQAQKESQTAQAQPGGNLTTSASSVSLHSKPASHRGVNYDVIEKTAAFEDDEAFTPLPTRWNRDDKYGALDILSDGLEVRYIGPRGQTERDHEAFSIRADNPMPPQCGIYYFEVQVLSGKRDDMTIGIGFSAKTVALSRPPGWEPDSWGYHSDDGHCYAGQNGGKNYGPPFTASDVIGCGVNFRTGCAFFTKNGHMLGTAFREIGKGSSLYPTVGLKKSGEHVRVNFGQTPFVFDIEGMMTKEKERIQREISETSTASLAPAMNETELIQALVLQFLQHDGYVETARAFAEEINAEKKALSLDPNAPIEGINVKDDEHANKRQRIRRAVLEGDIDRALKHTNAFYPQVLKDNEQVYFRLRCRKFIEMVRTAAEMRAASESKKSNGHGGDLGAMDLDANGNENGAWDQMDTEDSNEPAVDINELEIATLLYGQELHAEFKNDPRREVTKHLADIYALLAYANPLKEKDVAHLLDRKGRLAVAEELNSAILLSLGKSSRAALEKVYAQTSVLLDDLRENGGPGAFVSLQDVIEDIPKSQPF